MDERRKYRVWRKKEEAYYNAILLANETTVMTSGGVMNSIRWLFCPSSS